MCRFAYDKFLIDKSNNIYFKDTESIVKELNRLDEENNKLKRVFNTVLTSVSKDNKSCTLHISVDDYDYFRDLMISDDEEKTGEKTGSILDKPLRVNVNRDTITSYTSKMHPPCFIYDCNKCPYLEYPFCTYERRKKDKGVNDNE